MNTPMGIQLLEGVERLRQKLLGLVVHQEEDVEPRHLLSLLNKALLRLLQSKVRQPFQDIANPLIMDLLTVTNNHSLKLRHLSNSLKM